MSGSKINRCGSASTDFTNDLRDVTCHTCLKSYKAKIQEDYNRSFKAIQIASDTLVAVTQQINFANQAGVFEL